MKIKKSDLKKIIAEEKAKLVLEMNPDGTISDDEDAREADLMDETLRELDNMIQGVKAEADEIGGGFRSPGIKKRIFAAMADMIHRAR